MRRTTPKIENKAYKAPATLAFLLSGVMSEDRSWLLRSYQWTLPNGNLLS